MEFNSREDFAGFEDANAEGGTDDPGNRVGDYDDDETDRAVGHHPFGFVDLALVTAGGDPVDAADQEPNNKSEPGDNREDDEYVGDNFFDGSGGAGEITTCRLVSTGGCDIAKINVCHI